MTKEKTNDDLLKASPDASIELSEDQLDRVAGGANKNKSADKASAAAEGYIKG